MVQVWYSEQLIVENDTDGIVEATFDNMIKTDSIVLHIDYVKGDETSVAIQPLGLDEKLPGAYPVQRMTDAGIQNIIVTLSASGSYAVPIPLVKAWDEVKLQIRYNGGSAGGRGDVLIYVLADEPRG